ncbi:LacI family DNA-binding transcriptional regulator [Halalkalibacter krulwichiae]|uniref:Catabolite control protein A n=1 Tax=Halalkalibacter krulwichiae TaxID=199441 RepID=A0A1X9MDC1_9BACI|nr:LacI family DNA-binding transcriptional regulator [Halalkalibacter krulwichiae]ARK29551.1 Catabolite control protein A [Halalkalibacter krulwichiae]
MSVTIKDIAKHAGVSYSTVSKALRDSPLVKKPTKTKILKIAEELGYQPNVAARSLVQKKSFTIGVAWPSVERVAPSILITKINDLLEEHSYTTLLSINKLESAIATFNRFQVDAILVFGETEEEINNLKIQSTVPILYYGIEQHSSFPTIDVNRRLAIKIAVDYLQTICHQHIAFIGDLSSTDPMQKDKLLGFLEAMGIERPSDSPEFIVPTNGLEVHDGYLAAKSLLSSNKQVTAIVSGSYDLTRGILRAASEIGLTIPTDLSIISYDNIPQAENLDVRLTTVGVPITRIAQHISQTLLTIIEGETAENSIILEPELSIVDSCAPLP